MSNIDYYGLLNLLKRPKFLLVICVVFVIIIEAGGYRIFYRVPDEKHAELEIEFKAITPLPNASLFEYSSSQKITNALVTAYYTTDANSAAIFKYYDEQLKQHGWQFQGTNFGERAADYCKDKDDY